MGRLSLASTTIPTAVKQKPTMRLGHGLTVGAWAVRRNETMANRTPTTTHSQAKARIRDLLRYSTE